MQHNSSGTSIFVEHVQLHAFRCFEQLTLDFTSRVILIEGLNGVGKTSLLEALHYACYLRSFRTHIHKELVRFEGNTFFIKLLIRNDTLQHSIQAGFSQAKRIVKVDNKVVSSYKQLLTHYRVVSITEDDILLVTGAPEIRRIFLDQALLLMSPEYLTVIRKLRHTVDNRNMVIRAKYFDPEMYRFWTEQLWHISSQVQIERRKFLTALADEVQELGELFSGLISEIKFSYINKKMAEHETIENFWAGSAFLKSLEIKMGRSLFGAHLDDFEIVFQGKSARTYASRGQQKLILMLLKIAQLRLMQKMGSCAVILLDDFMTDFDEQRMNALISLLVATGSQLIFTSPAHLAPLHTALISYTPQYVKLTA